jgi:hypothetical protein
MEEEESRFGRRFVKGKKSKILGESLLEVEI